MDPTQLINQCRPYSATSGKYYIWNDTHNWLRILTVIIVEEQCGEDDNPH
jgi:hypothetical protein